MGWFRDLGDNLSKYIPGVDVAWKIGTGIYDAVNQKVERKEDQQLAKDNRIEDQQREDTSYQRTVADMRSAGLSPSTLSGGLDGGAVQSSIAPRSTPTLSSTDPFGGSLQYQMNKDSLDKQDAWQSETNRLKGIELGIMSDDADTRAKAQKSLSEWQEEQTRIASEEEKRKKAADEKALHESRVKAMQNLLSTGRFDSEMFTSSFSASQIGNVSKSYKGGTNLADAWRSMWTGDEASALVSFMEKYPNFRLDRIGYIDGKVPTPIFVDDKYGIEYYFNPSDGASVKHEVKYGNISNTFNEW